MAPVMIGGKLGAYVGLFLSLFLGGCGFPIPEELPLLFGGVWIARGALDPIFVIVLAITGIVLGDVTGYMVGRWMGISGERWRWMRRLTQTARFQRAKLQLQRRGLQAVLLGRFLPGIRVPLFVMAGFSRVPFKLFVLTDIAGVMGVAALMIPLGIVGHERIGQVWGWVRRIEGISLLACAVGLVGLILWKVSRRRRAETLTTSAP